MCPKCGGTVIDCIMSTKEGGWINDKHCINCGKRFYPLIGRERLRTIGYLRRGHEKGVKRENVRGD